MKQFSQRAIFAAVLLSTLSLYAAEAPRLPDEFTITERIISLVTTFDLAANKRSLGTVQKRFLSLATKFDWYDPSGALVATGRKQILSWGATVDVFDAENVKLGTIKEQVFRSLLKVYTYYSILDASGKQIAESEKVDWLATKFTIRDNKGYVVAEISRPWINWFRDRWTAKISDHKAIDSRLMVMIGVYKTDVDNARRASSSSN